MKKITVSSFKPFAYMLALILISPLYEVLNKSTENAFIITTVVDDWIPFIKEFIIPYLLWFPYLYGVLIYYFFADRIQYYITMSCIIVGKLVCFIIYYFWQTTVPRPAVTGNDIFSQLVRYIYETDQPVNCFPSIHVFTTFVIMLAAYKRKEEHKWEFTLLSIAGTLIIVSTVFTKQHAILDVISGMAVASVLYYGFQFVFVNKAEKVQIPAGEIKL